MSDERRRRIPKFLEAIGAFILVLLMLTVFVDVLGRNLLNKPLPWGTEVLELLMAGLIFVLYPVLALEFGHITVDLIAVRPILQRVQRTLGAFMGAVLFAIIAWCLVRQTLRAGDYGEATPLLGVPIAWAFGGMAVLAVCSSIGFLIATLRALRGPLPVRHLIVEVEKC